MAKVKSRFLWDVFLSHSSAQKPLVRAIVQQWRELGLSVFLDEDTIQPGEDIVTALDRARENSRYTVLMITPDSIASRWVDQELKSVVYLDPNAMERRLIPVLLEPVEESSIPLSVRRLNRADLTDASAMRRQYHRLLVSIGVRTRPLPDLPQIETQTDGRAARSLRKAVLETGAMPTDSRFYIERDVEQTILDLLENPGATITIKGYRQSGKSSLLARLHSRAVRAERACCILDLQGLDAETLEDTKLLFPALAQTVADRLNLDIDPSKDWSNRRGVKQSLTIFLEKQVLPRLDRPVLLLFDEADLTFPYVAVRQALFSTLRVWHNQRANDLDGRTWKKLGLVVAHSTDPSLWIKNSSQSPFNVGQEFQLEDFSKSEVADLNAKYDHQLRGNPEIDGLMEMVGGHPYLVRLALYTMATKPCSFAALKSVATNEDGPFAAHLRHMLNILSSEESLRTSIRNILNEGKCDDELVFQRLWSVGLIRGENRDAVWLRYTIYDHYFRKKLL